VRKQNIRYLGLAAALAPCLFLAMASSAIAAATEWQAAQNSRFRLISASGVPDMPEDTILAGLEIELEDGWKTYWRSPGDGLATEVDLSASENVAEAILLWPAPKRIEGAGGVTSYGYEGSVVLPIRVKAANADQNVLLRVELIYGVCADICIPVEGMAELSVPADDGSEHAATLANALGKVPYRQADGVYCSHRFTGARLNAAEDGAVLLIETAHDAGVTGRDLFIERGNGLALPPAELQAEPAPGQNVYAVRLDNSETTASIRDEQLILTMTSNQGSCETPLRIE
jgi:DsbC/DsbD-like thiol-disulfide interchange protein